jgi:rhodanese-related sulfurtransferase
MRKTLFGLLLLGTTLMAKVTNLPVTIEFVDSNKMKIIDIRTEGEWKQMGVITDAYLITFFDEHAKYDIKNFLKKLDKIIEKKEEFAIICNTASRTKLVSNFLGKKLDYNVVNLTGGMMKLIKDGYKVELYEADKSEKKVQMFDNNRSK